MPPYKILTEAIEQRSLREDIMSVVIHAQRGYVEVILGLIFRGLSTGPTCWPSTMSNHDKLIVYLHCYVLVFKLILHLLKLFLN